MTRAQLRLRTMRAMDATNPNNTYSARWNTTAGAAGEVDPILGFIHAREWKRILNALPYYRMSERSLTSDATTGRYSIADLSTADEKFYRLLAFAVDDLVYYPDDFRRNVPTPSAINANTNRFVVYRMGNVLATMPVQYSKAATAWVNITPMRVEDLADDTTTVTFPDDYEYILVYESAAHLMAKGGAELEAAQMYRGLAEEMRRDMLQDLARFSIAPLQFGGMTDSAYDWAGGA